MKEERTYFCIDLKSFYASVECVERGLDPMSARLVVADPERGEGTICLAVSPALKALGVRNRCRVYEIPQGLEYVMAEPRMKLYIDYAARIYGIYLDYLAKEDIHVYSVDEAFFDATAYLRLYRTDGAGLARRLMGEVLRRTGLRATAGVGTNLYLAKVALDIVAKHARNFIGVLDEEGYRRTLWGHLPLTDFWRVGPGTVARLAALGLRTMGDVARAPEEPLYRMFGVDAELLIDHAWGRETVTMADIKAYRPRSNSLSAGQVLLRDYGTEEALVVVKEMMDQLCLDMAERRVATESVTLWVAYARGWDGVAGPARRNSAAGAGGGWGVAAERREGLCVAGTATLARASSSARNWMAAVEGLYGRMVERGRAIRRVGLCCNRLVREERIQFGLFDNPGRERKAQALQRAVNGIKRRFGKDALLKGMDFEEGATTRERNHQIGGHKSGE